MLTSKGKGQNGRILERLVALHPKLIDLSLDRMRRLLENLGNPEARLPKVIHIAGTNGKGSTLAYLEAIFLAKGLKEEIVIVIWQVLELWKNQHLLSLQGHKTFLRDPHPSEAILDLL